MPAMCAEGRIDMNTAPRSRFPAQTAHPSTTVLEAAEIMCSQGAGALVVVDPDSGLALYAITDRDFVYAIVGRIDAERTTLAEFVVHPNLRGAAECWFG